jgi:hypothetical protein
MILGTANVKDDLLVQVMTRFEDNKPWKGFIQSIRLYSGDEEYNKEDFEMPPTFTLYAALHYTFGVNWIREVDYISPSCFMYLVERLLLLTSWSNGFMYATKSSFTEWLICQDENSLSNLSFFMSAELHIAYDFIGKILHMFVCDQNDTKTWIKNSNLDVKNYFPSLLLQCVVSMCLLHLGSGSEKYIKLLRKLLGRSYIAAQLPFEFFHVLQKGKELMGLEVLAEAFKVIGNPLVIAKLLKNSSEIVCSDAVFVDLTTHQKRELILEKIFPIRVDTAGEETPTEAFDSSNLPNESSASVSDQASDGQKKDEIGTSMYADLFWNWFERVTSPSTDVSRLAGFSPEFLKMKVRKFFLCFK